VLAGYEVNYDEVGREAARIAAKILKGTRTATSRRSPSATTISRWSSAPGS